MRAPERNAAADRRLTIPNLITLVRLALAPAFALAGTDGGRGLVLALATASEWLDGWLARRTGQTSRLGELLDPVVDRIFVLTAFLTFLALGRLSWAQLGLLLLRDLFTAFGALASVLLRWRLRLRARMAGKVVTTLQLGALVLLLLWPEWLRLYLPVVVAVSLVAVADYTRAALRARAAREPA